MVFMGVTHVERVAALSPNMPTRRRVEMKKVFDDGPSDSLNVFVQLRKAAFPPGNDRPRQPAGGRASGWNATPRMENALKMFMIDSLKKANHQPGDVSALIL